MRITLQLAAAAGLVALACGCAQVPKESITLSDTVGRDVTAIEASHRKFVDLVYDGYERDVNAFVDDVYLPYYIRESLKSATGQELLSGLQQAARDDATVKQRQDAYDRAELWLKVAHRRVDRMRAELLAPLKEQRKQILGDLDTAYTRVLKANAAVTGYLASLAKVTDLQNQLMDELGVPNLSERVGNTALEVSSVLDKQLPAAERKTAEAEAVRDKLKAYLARWRAEKPAP